MLKIENMYWELMNNEIRRVFVDDSSRETTITTAFRSIQNKLVFKNVAWNQDVMSLRGSLINYAEKVSEEGVSEDDMEDLRDGFIENFDYEFLTRTGLNLYRIVCNKNTKSVLFVAEDMEIVING